MPVALAPLVDARVHSEASVKTALGSLLFSVLAVPLLAETPPPRSVWTADYSQDEIEAAVAAGKTTLLYSGGSSMAVANHVEVARYVARRVAEELGGALVLPVTASESARRSSARGAPDAYEVVSGALRASRFTDVVIIADEGTSPTDRSMQDLAQRLNADFSASGVRVHYVTAH